MNMNNTQLAVMPQHELAVAMSAQQAKALIESKFTIALHRPRSLAEARESILEACKRPGFAEQARYKKPVGGGFVEGPSIRFAEEAIRAMKNVDVSTTLLYEDDMKRLVRITVMDLESNTSYGDDVSIVKTIERKGNNLRGRDVLAERKNSHGETVYICACTEDELANKMAAAKSKVIRNSGLRLVPSDIIEEAMQEVDRTLSCGGHDPKEQSKKLLDAFAGVGVSAKEIERYIGRGVSTISPKETAELRGIYTAIKEGETTWREVLEAKGRPAAEGEKASGFVKKEPPPVVEAVVEEAPKKRGRPKKADPEPEAPVDAKILLGERLEAEEITPDQAAAVFVDQGLLSEGQKFSDLDSETAEMVLENWETFISTVK